MSGIIPSSLTSAIQNPFSRHPTNGVMASDFTDGFFINEFINGVEGQTSKQRIKLLGNQMPFQPFDWEGEQRLVKNYYPGNPEPAVHVLGPKEGPVTIKGRFKDKRYKDKGLYGVSYQFVLLVDEMRKRGNLVQFGMRGTSGSWTRYGFIEHCKYSMNKLSWIDYDITFFVIGEKQPVNNYFAAPSKDNPSQSNANLIALAAKFNATYSTVPTSVPQSLAGLINEIVSAIATQVNAITGFVSLVLNTVQSVEDAALRALGLIKNLKTTLYGFMQQLGRIENAFKKNNGTNPSLAASAQYVSIAFGHEVRAGINGIMDYLSRLEAEFAAIKLTLPKARYKVISGDTLQNISIKYYRASDNWIDIYNHNKLNTTQLHPGAVLEIPNL